MPADSLNPWALAMLVVACVIVLTRSGRAAVGAILITALVIPVGQMFMVGGFHVRFVPILIAVGLIRGAIHGELVRIQMTTLDRLFIAAATASLICTCLRGAVAGTFNDFFNTAGAYLVFRSLMTENEDIVSALRLLALVGVGMGAVMLYEHVTGRNPFFVLGGVSLYDDVRDGRARCQGAFRHPLMAGAFGATLLPLMIGLWHQGGRDRRRAVWGIVGSTVITITAVSSGALLTFIAGVIGMWLWRIRDRMSLFRRGIVAGLILLALIMKAPVWYIIAQISDRLGGSGWHRSFLIDQFIHHFNEWWLIGTSYTAHWAPSGEVILGNTNMMDITNHYVAQGIMGGLIGLILFISVLVSCFKIVGRLVHGGGSGTLTPKFIWMLGASVGAHSVAFISVWYFDQITIYWNWLVAAISSLAAIYAASGTDVAGEHNSMAEGDETSPVLEEDAARS
jgi:hypothetical protein